MLRLPLEGKAVQGSFSRRQGDTREVTWPALLYRALPFVTLGSISGRHTWM